MREMFYYIYQLCPILFHWIGSNWFLISRSDETDLARLTLVVAVITVNAYSLIFVSQTCLVTLRIQELVSSVSTVLSDSKEMELGSNNKEATPSAGKKIGVILVSCNFWQIANKGNSVIPSLFKGPYVLRFAYGEAWSKIICWKL